jgi:thiamine pyrophosphate-dependent acetolactate synthase large subunit-like protein
LDTYFNRPSCCKHSRNIVATIFSEFSPQLVRQFVKWDDQPASVPAALNSILRANHMAATKPFGPTYVPLDLTFQEDAIEPGSIPIPDISRFQPGHRVGPSVQDVEAVTALLSTAKKPLFMFGRMGRSVKDWEERVAFVEKLHAAVITDGKQAAAFPYPHRCQPSAPR